MVRLTNDKQLVLSTSSTRYGPWSSQLLSLGQLYHQFSTPRVSVECLAAYLKMPKKQQDDLKDVGGFLGGRLLGNARRNADVVGRSLLTLDVDAVEVGGTERVLSAVERLGCGYVVYSTRKHSHDKPRLRVVIPLHEELSADEYEPCARFTAAMIDPSMLVFDRTTFEPARLMYWPSVCSDGEFVYRHGDKPLLDGKVLLGMVDWRDVSRWPRCPGESEALLGRVAGAKQKDPMTKDGVVGAFCRVHDIHSAIDTYLPGVYVGDGDRLTFTGGSTQGGAVLYEDGTFLFSHHGTDPCSGHLVNAFDLVRLHLYGSMDDDVKPGTPVHKTPSWAQMLHLIEQDAAVVELRAQERAQELMQMFEGVVSAVGESGAVEGSVEATQAAVALTVQGAAGLVSRELPTPDRVRELSETVLAPKSPVTLDAVSGVMELMGISARRNLRSSKVEVEGMPRQFSQEQGANIAPVLVSDALKKLKMPCGVDAAATYLFAAADACRYDPVLDWFRALPPWDGVDRVSELYRVLGVVGDSGDDYLSRELVRRWLLQCVAMAFNREARERGGIPCHGGVMYQTQGADGALVLQGPQGCGKTSFFTRLCPSPEWMVAGVTIDMTNKDTIIKALGGWITELGELDSTMKREQSELKAFITSDRDDIRAPYGRSSVVTSRTTSFCATVNLDQFLKDYTGSRRWWTVPVEEMDIQAILHWDRGFIEGVWAQVYQMWWHDPFGFRLTGEIRSRVETRNAGKNVEVSGEGEIESLFNYDLPVEQWGKFTPTEISNLVGGKLSARDVGYAMAALSRKDQRITFIRSKTTRSWRAPISRG